jgi:hypothetical protein
MQCPPMINPAVEYSLSDGKNNVYDKLPEWLQKKIAGSKEWDSEAKTNGSEPDEDDEIPF